MTASAPPDVPPASGPAPLTEAQRQAIGGELDRLLGHQLGRVRRRFFVHGLAFTLALPGAAIALFFLLDHALRLPAPIRLFHTAAVTVLLGWAIARFLRYPLSRHFAATDVAILLERTFPGLHQRLVSAIQLKDVPAGDLRNQSPAMIAALLQETATAARALPLERLFDGQRTRRAWAAAGTITTLLAVGSAMAPATAIAFVLRHLGLSVSYPKATRLIVDLPPAGPELQRTDHPGRTELVLPAGADLHVSVLAEGTVPSEVHLDVTGVGGDERSITLVPRPGDRFRHVFRRLGNGFSFHARGGDDDTGDKIVEVRTIHPPLVGQIKVELTPPAYTGKPPATQAGGAIEALVGTRATLMVTATATVHDATLLFLESGRKLDLVATTIQDDSGAATAYTAQFTVEQSDRYQIDLTGEGGLRNPTPGTYPIVAMQDYAPVGRWLQPEDESATLLLPQALLCVRVDAHDDHGLTDVRLTIDAGGGRTRALALLPPLAEGASWPVRGQFLELLELQELLGAQKAAADGLSLQLALRDNRQPEAGATELQRRQVQIVDLTQLAATIARNFRSLREEVEQAADLQTDRAARIEDLRSQAAIPGNATAQALTAVEVGQGRILTSAERVHRGLMRAFDQHLWNRLESSQHAAKVVDLYRTWFTQPRSDAPPNALVDALPQDEAFYRDVLARRRAGTLGAMENVLDPILQMIDLADGISHRHGPQLARMLAQAQVARDGAELTETLRRIVEAQQQIAQALAALLLQLDRWNEIQDLVQETRALLDRQRDVMDRTDDLKDKK
ncbi:MAG: hypothetical protein IPK26_13960 [Planctomycetes bacterium]|nr:hypothetical protein [Planctomycetota bacterium]